MARPTDYNEEMLQKARKYQSQWNLLYPDDHIPTIEGLALHIDIARSTIYEWISQEDKKEFSDIVSKIMEQQGKILINKGLDNTFNASITKVMITKHGYRDAIDTDITSKGEQVNTADPKLQVIAEEYEQKIKKTL